MEISADIPNAGRKICSETACVFFDSESIAKDSKERSTSMRKLLIAVNVILTTVELIEGLKWNSLAILTDA